MRKKTTIYVDSALLREVRARAARTGREDADILEDALRQYLATPQAATSRQELRELLDELAARTHADDQEALDVAYAELEAARRARRRR
ncbi:MAG TPA: ribbon-helix-helix protein, CopG family [Chloroflexota bacterium]|nr:ribbon-helix-helix protein, CopG family [Chloroflexota bacterium]